MLRCTRVLRSAIDGLSSVGATSLKELLNKLRSDGFPKREVPKIYNHPDLNANQAVEVFQQMKAANHRIQYSSYLIFLARKGEEAEVLKGVEMAKSDGYRATWAFDYAFMLLHAAKYREKETLDNISNLRAFKHMFKHQMDFAFCVEKIGTLENLKKLENLWSEMRARTCSEIHVVTSFTYQYSKYGDMDSAARIISEYANKVKPDKTIFAPVISVAARNGDFNKVRHLLSMMEEAGIAQDLTIHKCVVTAATQTTKKQTPQEWEDAFNKLIGSTAPKETPSPNQSEAKVSTQGVQQRQSRYITRPGTEVTKGFRDTEQMKQWIAAQDQAGVMFAEQLFVTLLEACQEAGDAKALSFWLLEMRKHGYEPKKIYYARKSNLVVN